MMNERLARLRWYHFLLVAFVATVGYGHVAVGDLLGGVSVLLMLSVLLTCWMTL